MTQITDYHAKYYAYELTKRVASDNIQKLAATLVDAQVDLNPHQVEAALFAFKSPLSKGAILADEVGLGKTIEAGMVIAQKWAERKRKILLIMPANLRKQWNQELQDKFFLPSMILETTSFNEQVKKKKFNPFEQDTIVICSYQFARSKESYIQSVNWDLVAVDEAHRLRNVYKPTNKIANSIKAAIAHCPVLLLTATPLQNSLLELYGLVSFIDEYTFGDLKSFKSQFVRVIQNEESFDDLKTRLKPICKRTLRKQVREYINFTNRMAITEEFFPSDDEQTLYEMVSDYLQRERLFALPPSQRKLMTLMLRKLLASSTFAIDGTLKALIFRLDALLKKQATDSVLEEVALDMEILEEVTDEWLADEEEETKDAEKEKIQYTPEDIDLIKKEREYLQKAHELAASIKKNTKGEILQIGLQKGLEQIERLGGKKKAIIFTESRRTQEYLLKILNETKYAGKIVLFNGSNTDEISNRIYKEWVMKYQDTDKVTSSKTADKRAALVEYFKDTAEIMLATEAAAEGINLQFCSLVVNYDLPWNPQRIEQRIGRCHRYGQTCDVVVVNFLNKQNAADQRVYELLKNKFKLFDGVFGASDEVLGTISSGMDFEKRISDIYQKCRTSQDIQLSFDQLQSELEQQITETITDVRKKLFENFDEEVQEKLKVSKMESEQYLSKYENWLWDISKLYLGDNAEYDGKEKSFTLKKNPFIGEHIDAGPYRIGKNIEDAHVYRIGHPLAQRIIDNYKNAELSLSELHFDYSSSGKRITILDQLKNKSGTIKAELLTINALEPEDYVVLSGVTDTGDCLDEEQCKRIFSLPAKILNSSATKHSQDRLAQLSQSQIEAIITENANRNSVYFDDEMTKLEKWADDIKSSLEIQLKELDKEIKTLKTEAKKIVDLDEKVKSQRHIKDLEKKRNEMRKNLFQAQDQVDTRKDQLITSVENKIKQKIENKDLFCIFWRII